MPRPRQCVCIAVAALAALAVLTAAAPARFINIGQSFVHPSLSPFINNNRVTRMDACRCCQTYPCAERMGFYYGMQAAFFDVADREPGLPLVRFISLAENGTDKQNVLRAFDPHTYFCVAGDVCASSQPNTLLQPTPPSR